MIHTFFVKPHHKFEARTCVPEFKFFKTVDDDIRLDSDETLIFLEDVSVTCSLIDEVFVVVHPNGDLCQIAQKFRFSQFHVHDGADRSDHSDDGERCSGDWERPFLTNVAVFAFHFFVEIDSDVEVVVEIFDHVRHQDVDLFRVVGETNVVLSVFCIF